MKGLMLLLILFMFSCYYSSINDIIQNPSADTKHWPHNFIHKNCVLYNWPSLVNNAQSLAVPIMKQEVIDQSFLPANFQLFNAPF